MTSSQYGASAHLPAPVENQTPIDAAVSEAKSEAQTVTVLGGTYRLVKGLSLVATYDLDKAQREESVSGLVDALSKVIHKDDRAEFVRVILSEPEGDEEPIALEDFFNIFSDALQKVAGRPLDTTTS